MGQMLYGSGLRLIECCQLRIKDVDFGRRMLTIRDGKRRTDRVTVLPQTLVGPLTEHVTRIKRLWEADRQSALPGVWLPDALDQKYLAGGPSVGLVLGVSGTRVVGRYAQRHLPPAPCPRERDAEGHETSGRPSWNLQARQMPHAAAQLCDAPAGKRLRYSDRAGAVGPRRRKHDDDLYPCAQPPWPGRAEARWTSCGGD